MASSPFSLASQPALASLVLAYINEGIDQYQLVNTCHQLKSSFEIACDAANNGERSIIRTTTKAREGVWWSVCPADRGSGDILTVNAVALARSPADTNRVVKYDGSPPWARGSLSALEEARLEIARAANSRIEIVHLPWNGGVLVVNGGGAIHANFQHCPKVTSIDLSRCSEVTTVGDQFGNECKHLRSMSLPPSIQTIGDSFLFRSLRVTTIDLRHCEKLRNVGASFAAVSYGLRSVVLPKSVEILGWGFLNESAVSDVDLSRCTKLQAPIGSICWRCQNLRRVALPPDGSIPRDRIDVLHEVDVTYPESPQDPNT